MRERKKVVMKRQKLVSTLLSAFLLANCLAFRTSASEIESLSISDLQHERIEEITSNILGVTPRASVRFEADIEENSISEKISGKLCSAARFPELRPLYRRWLFRRQF